MSNKHFIGKRLFSFSDNGLRDPVSRVTLLVDAENAVTAGDDTGLELVANCPYADETLAKALLNQVKGYQYRAFEAQSVVLDPAAELGDGITAERVYSILAGMTDKGDGYPDITAPGNREEADEYPEGGPMTRLFNRELANARSLISKTSESIRLEVSSLEKKTKEDLESLKQYADSENEEVLESTLELYAALEVSLKGISGKVTSLEEVTTTQGTTITGLQTELNAVPGQISASVNESKQYTNTKYNDATKYVDGKADEVLKTSLDRSAALEISLNGISGRVESLESVTTTQGTTITSLQTELNAVPGQISASVSKSEQYTNTKYNDATKYADNAAAGAKTYADGKADEVLKTSLDRSAALEVSLNGISGRVESLETVTTTQGTSITSLQTELNAVPGQITASVSELKGYTDGEFATLSAQYTSLSLDVEGIEGEVSGLDGKYTSLSQTVEGWKFTDEDGTVLIDGGMVNAEGLTVKAANITGSLSSAQLRLYGDMSVYEKAPGEGQTWEQMDVGGHIGWYSTPLEGIGVYKKNDDGAVCGLLVCNNNHAYLGHYLGGSSIRAHRDYISCEASEQIRFEVNSTRVMRVQYDDSDDVYSLSPYKRNASDAARAEQADLGASNTPWGTVYADTDTIETSDRNRKNTIEDLPDKYVALFDLLIPRRFKLNNGKSGRFHVGYIAQEVEEAMAAVGIDSQEFGGFVKSKSVDEDGQYIYMLRYGEFGPMYAAKIKQLEARLARLEETK